MRLMTSQRKTRLMTKKIKRCVFVLDANENRMPKKSLFKPNVITLFTILFVTTLICARERIH